MIGVDIQIQEFETFYSLLMKNAPEGYKPWFFPCEKKGKNPGALAISQLAGETSLCCDIPWIKRLTKEEERKNKTNKEEKRKNKPRWICDKCEKSRGSWHGLHARLTKEKCIEHIKQGFNLGISARENDQLIIGDVDNIEYLNQMPKDTLTTTSRKRAGGHFFGWDKDGSAKINFSTEDDGEIRSSNQYVLAPGSNTPFNMESKKDKEVFNALPEVARKDKFMGYYTVRNACVPRPLTFDDFPEFFKIEHAEEEADKSNPEKEYKEFNGEGKYSELFKLKISDIIGDNPSNKRTGHPLHDSDTDANWSLSKDGSLGMCWRHCVSLNAVQYLCVKAGYSTCSKAGTPHGKDKDGKPKKSSKLKGNKEALEIAYKEALKMKLIKEYIGPIYNLKEIQLPKTGRLISTYSNELTNNIKDKNILFFRPGSREIIEINKIKDEKNKKEYTGFISVKPNRLITVIEKYMKPGARVYNEKTEEWEFKVKSMSNSVSQTVLDSPMMQEGLPMIERIFQVPIPIIYDKKLTFPKRGYDERFNSWLPPLAPEITQPEMDIEKAKLILNNVYKDFCFKDNQDKINAIAGLLTPFLKGLYPTFNTRMPGFNYSGNRERVGKDYCAGITGITHEGEALEEPPISNNEKSNNSNDELRKKFMAALLQGKKRFHSSNNKGYIDNAVLESFLTLTSFSDRILGRNEIFSFDNEIDFSMSSNQGTTMTPDLVNRCINVNLFFDKEDANARTFSIPNLHHYIKNNRDIILSALYSLVRNWIDAGSPDGSKPFASYPDWARICGGILETAKIGNPCVKSGNAFLLATDTETQDMKTFFELMYEAMPEIWTNQSEIKVLIKQNEDNPFAYLDFDKRGDQTKFGQRIDKFVGRIFSDIKLICIKDAHKNSKNKYKFAKEKRTYKNQSFKSQGKKVLDDNLVNLPSTIIAKTKVISVGGVKQVDKVDKVDKSPTLKEPDHNLATLTKCQKCNSKDIINYPDKKIYCKKCRENYNQK